MNAAHGSTYTSCLVCGKTFRQNAIGRTRKYCVDACKAKAHRTHGAPEPRRREYNTVRTDYLERRIAFALATGSYGAADELRKLAQHIGAPLDERRVDEQRAQIARAADNA